MTGIVEFLAARLDETQADAEAAIADRSGTERWEAKGFPERDRVEWIVRDVEEKYASHGYPGHTPVAGVVPGGPRDGGGVAAHIARHDPACVLAEVKAKRALLREIETITIHATEGDDPDFLERPAGRMLRAMASPHAEHADYKPKWAMK